mmetsp:Transcript_19463/g.45288  ORF Transcript_19463/g.45288 Transcript_19463/m.45288 type:complete len:113 (-) Transcript_19463:884-1222(-)|eukprot:CAMPEP_0116830548 /NCGR_PEP_ID=MMETSP0418-20121206/4822_1 /TAXON_ID=1158023 /ORGANISM="Astrosyne radiata, Strain 13vi08-1A" /LENGTH=112 /DNA_ID=CAMNT_0004459659 /DNA_START=119 /DNA_END=457 /DNA_ORIENTATION=+
MAQGSGKLKRKQKTGAQQKKQKAKKVGKGRKYHAPKKLSFSARSDLETTKSINKKNEALISARAVGDGTRFFLKDVKEMAKKEMKTSSKKDDNKKNNKFTNRVEKQLNQIKK